MSYSEFELIRRCFVDEGLGFDRDGVVLGIGDDAAIVQPPNGMAIALSLDTLVEGVHFLKHAPARLLARRALARRCGAGCGSARSSRRGHAGA